MSEEEFSYLDVSKECSMSLENYLFLGDSITHRYNIDKYFPDIPIVNSGVGATFSNIAMTVNKL